MAADTTHMFQPMGALVRGVHERLVDELATVAKDARIPPHWVYQPVGTGLTPEEKDWIKGFHKHTAESVAGLAYAGATVQVEERMCRVAGVLLRNFVRARVLTVQGVFNEIDAGEALDVSCLLIPNLVVAEDVGAIPKWRAHQMTDLLLERFTTGRQTVVYVSGDADLAKIYGTKLQRHIESHYVKLSI